MPEELDKRIAATYERDLKIAEWLETSYDPKTGPSRLSLCVALDRCCKHGAALCCLALSALCR